MIVDAIVLAGGEARRLGGASKPAIMVGDVSLLSRVLRAADLAQPRFVVIVGPPELAAEGAVLTREDPPFGGPVAGLAAGLARLAAEHPAGHPADHPAEHPAEHPEGDGWVLLLACDLPRASEAVALLLQGAEPADDGAHLVDATGRAQWLVGLYRRSALSAALAAVGEPRGESLRAVMNQLALHAVDDPQRVSADVDTWHDVDQARQAVQTGEYP